MRIAISAGEASGDLHGAALLKELRRLDPDVSAYAVGGSTLRSEGAEIIADSGVAGAIGIFEAVKMVPRMLTALSKLKHELRRRPPDVLIPIDCGAFNTRVARFAKTLAIPTLYYIPPGSWRKRLNPKARDRWLGDVVVTPFPWNADNLRAAGHDAFFFGHPLLDLIGAERGKDELRAEFGYSDSEFVIGLLPGSREAEVAHMWKQMVGAAIRIRQEEPHCKFLTPLADSLSRAAREYVERSIRQQDQCEIRTVAGRAHDVMRASDLIITASGTATLESAIIGCPMVIVYRGNRLSYWQYLLVRKSIPFMGMPNNIAGMQICPELIQQDVNAERMSSIVLELMREPRKLEEMRGELNRVRDVLGQPGAIRKTAEKVLELANRRILR